jgi:hypothetical protein
VPGLVTAGLELQTTDLQALRCVSAILLAGRTVPPLSQARFSMSSLYTQQAFGFGEDIIYRGVSATPEMMSPT